MEHEQKEQKKRGGSRAGAGRKSHSLLGTRIKRTFKFTPEDSALIDNLSKKLNIAKVDVLSRALKYFKEKQELN